MKHQRIDNHDMLSIVEHANHSLDEDLRKLKRIHDKEALGAKLSAQPAVRRRRELREGLTL